MAQQTIVAHFDSRADAQKAVAALVQAGIAQASVSLLPEESGSSSYQRSTTTSAYNREKDEGGFLASLGNLFLPEEDRYAYAEGMSRGGATVSVEATGDAQATEVMDLLERHGAVDIDERAQSWRSEGWSGHAAGTTTAATGTANLGAARVRDDGVVERAEERLVVGKRQAAGSRVRVRSYVVETPVEEQVTLQQERVHVERRRVDRPVGAGDNVFRGERVIEATERSEEAVVAKEARVVEEIGLRKEADTRTETVRDTVRRQEVEVEDDRTARGGTGVVTETAGTTVTRDDGAVGRDRR